MLSVDVSNGLREELEALALKNKARAIGVALHDLETGFRFSLRGDRWFHAASTIKVAVLLAVFRAADQGRLRLDDSLHVRNRFFSAADGSVFRVSQDRDATPELYAAIGRTAKISALAHAMICGSSNLAANLLLDFVGVEYARTVLREAQVDGVELRRGVEDHGAHERAINNEATADGLLSLLSAIRFSYARKQTKGIPHSAGAAIQLDDSRRSASARHSRAQDRRNFDCLPRHWNRLFARTRTLHRRHFN